VVYAERIAVERPLSGLTRAQAELAAGAAPEVADLLAALADDRPVLAPAQRRQQVAVEGVARLER
jgi:hypothetical protein